MTSAKETSLSFKQVSIARGTLEVVHSVDLEVPAGAVTVLLGPNGAGKSTLVMTAAGVLPIKSGVISAGSAGRISGLRPHKIRAAGVATVLEGHRILSSLTVAENLRVSASDSAHVTAALELFPELAKLGDRVAGLLSGGEQQMLALAQALTSDPSFLLLDELSFGLAPVIVRRLIPVVRQIADTGVGVLLVEQFAKVALEIADHAAVLSMGEIVFAGEPATLMDQPEILQSAYLHT